MVETHVVPLGLVVAPSFPAKNLKELVVESLRRFFAEGKVKVGAL